VITAAIRTLVVERAENQCEYCRAPQGAYGLLFHIDHVVPRQHGGVDDVSSYALACAKCNRKKGPNLSGIDPSTGAIVELFNPRRDPWSFHFRWSGPLIISLTPTGGATISALGLNETERLTLRQSLMDEGQLRTK
jgi:hypothetical protein